MKPDLRNIAVFPSPRSASPTISRRLSPSTGVASAAPLADGESLPDVAAPPNAISVRTDVIAPFDTVRENGHYGQRMYVFNRERGRLTEILTMREINGTWTVESGDIRSYTTSGLLATRTEFSMLGTYSKGIQSYLYDPEGRILSNRYAGFVGTENAPRDEILDSAAYDAQGHRVYGLSEHWSRGKLRYGTSFVQTLATDTSEVVTGMTWQRGEWIEDGRNIWTWSNGNRRLSVLCQRWNGATWVEAGLWVMTFDEEMRILTDSDYECINGTWVGVYRSTTRYGISEPFLNEWEQEDWEGTAWVLRGRGQWTTDANGRTLAYTSQCWSNGVVSDEAGAYVYTADGCVRQTDSAWTNGALRLWETYVTDASGQELLSEGFCWDEEKNSWEGQQRSTTHTPAGNESERELRIWSAGSWQPVERYLFSYDEADRIRSIERFVGVLDHWASAHDPQALRDATPWVFGLGPIYWIDLGVWFDCYYDLTFTYRDGITGVSRTAEGIPEHSALQQNYPNPFNPSTTFPFSIATGAHTTIVIFDVIGREVARPVDAWKDPGEYQVEFDARGLASGMYICRFTSGSVIQTQKLMLVR